MCLATSLESGHQRSAGPSNAHNYADSAHQIRATASICAYKEQYFIAQLALALLGWYGNNIAHINRNIDQNQKDLV